MDSLSTISVGPHQYPSHQSILLNQRPIHESFTKNIWELAILKNSVFMDWPFWFFFKKKEDFAWFPGKSVTKYVIEWMGLNITLHSILRISGDYFFFPEKLYKRLYIHNKYLINEAPSLNLFFQIKIACESSGCFSLKVTVGI